MITLLEENETLTQIVYNAGRPHTQPPANVLRMAKTRLGQYVLLTIVMCLK